MRAHVLPRFGDVQLANLTRRGIDLWIGELYRNGRSTAGNAGRHGSLSPKTVHNVHSVLRTALRQAVRWGLITSNPAEGVTLPRTQPKQPATWQADDMAGFLAAIESHRLAGPLRLLAMTGLRRGEWLGLRWSAVDLNSATLSITTTRVRVGREMVETDPKTARGRRTIPIDPQTVEALRAWRRAQAAEMLAAGAGRSSELLVTNAAGLPLTTSALRRQLDGVIRDAGLPRITPHGLRHSHATLARDTTELEEVSRRLGHSDPSFTARVYVAPRSEHQRAGVDELAQRLSSRKRGA
jgi:integrase